MSYDQELMDRCISHALKNPIQSRGKNTIGRMAAMMVLDSSIWKQEIVGLNQYKTHPMMKRFSKNDNKIFLHAEIDVLIKALRKMSYLQGALGGNSTTCFPNYDIYVVRVLKDGTPALAKPCDTCMGALTYFGIRNIYWTK